MSRIYQERRDTNEKDEKSSETKPRMKGEGKKNMAHVMQKPKPISLEISTKDIPI